ncbi:MAG: hypothetical protein WAL52_19075 [Candidatus Sulfotelmatobacter sp.]
MSQAQGAIPGWHFFLHEHLKSSLRQPCFEPLRQVDIVKGSATEAYMVDLSQEHCQLGEPLDQPVVETPADRRHRKTPIENIEQRFK